MNTSLEIRIDDLSAPEVGALLAEHLAAMAAASPPESRHALNLDGLRQPEVTFWSSWQNHQLIAIGALKELAPDHGEIKSMRTASNCLRHGFASRMLEHIIAQAKNRGYQRLSLETGSMAYFKPAHALYQKFGFKTCPPFADYIEDPNSLFMTKLL